MNSDEINEFEIVKTGNGYTNDLAATTNKRLEQTIMELRSLQLQLFALDQSQMDSVKATEELKTTIIRLDKQNGVLNKRLYWLTIITGLVAVIQAFPIIKDLVFR